MRPTSQKLIQRSLVQPTKRTYDEPARIKVCSGVSPFCSELPPYDTVIVLQLCNFDMKSPTLNERIAVVFAFPGHLASDALRSSLTDLLDVRKRAASASQLQLLQQATILTARRDTKFAVQGSAFTSARASWYATLQVGLSCRMQP